MCGGGKYKYNYQFRDFIYPSQYISHGIESWRIINSPTPMKLNLLYFSASFLYLFEYFLFFLIITVSMETFYHFNGEYCSFSKRQESETQFLTRAWTGCQAIPQGLPHTRCPECLCNKWITLVQFHTHIYLPFWVWKTESLKTYIKTAFERGNIC